MLLYICRHGQTDHNLRGIIQGQLDTPLNDHGRFEARRLAQALAKVHFDEAYTSPLSRACATADAILARHPEVKLCADPLIKERGLGSMEGRRRLRGERAPPDAESHADLTKRTWKWLSGLLKTHSRSQPLSNDLTPESIDTPTVLVVSHGAWIGSLINVLLSRPIASTLAPGVDLDAHLLNTCVIKVRLWQDEKRWRGEIIDYGNLDHLKDVEEPDLEIADDVKD